MTLTISNNNLRLYRDIHAYLNRSDNYKLHEKDVSIFLRAQAKSSTFFQYLLFNNFRWKIKWFLCIHYSFYQVVCRIQKTAIRIKQKGKNARAYLLLSKTVQQLTYTNIIFTLNFLNHILASHIHFTTSDLHLHDDKKIATWDVCEFHASFLSLGTRTRS